MYLDVTKLRMYSFYYSWVTLRVEYKFCLHGVRYFVFFLRVDFILPV